MVEPGFGLFCKKSSEGSKDRGPSITAWFFRSLHLCTEWPPWAVPLGAAVKSACLALPARSWARSENRISPAGFPDLGIRGGGGWVLAHVVRGGMELSGGHFEINDSRGRKKPARCDDSASLRCPEPRGYPPAPWRCWARGARTLPGPCPDPAAADPAASQTRSVRQDTGSVFTAAPRSETRVWAETEGAEIVDVDATSSQLGNSPKEATRAQVIHVGPRVTGRPSRPVPCGRRNSREVREGSQEAPLHRPVPVVGKNGMTFPSPSQGPNQPLTLPFPSLISCQQRPGPGRPGPPELQRGC